MANGSAPKSLDDMLQADRKKRKAESLAQEIFGRNKRQSAPTSGRSTPAPGASLASRMGISKQRSTSSSSIIRDRQLGKVSRNPVLSRAATAHRLETVLSGADDTVNQVRAKPVANGSIPKASNGEISIRGAAGPYTVVAQNFAPGTTAADIESVMQPIGGDIVSCRLIASNPTVIAEIVFLDRIGADKVIAMFNNKKADGRVLHVYMKELGGSFTKSAPKPITTTSVETENVAMEVDDQAQQQLAYQEDQIQENYARPRRDERPQERNAASQGRYPYSRGGAARAEPAYQDGRYGFTNNEAAGRDYSRGNGWGGGGQLYSDNGGRRSGYRGGRW